MKPKHDAIMTALLTVFGGIMLVSTIATLVSRQSNTTGVIKQTGQSFFDALTCALSPVTGASCGGNQLTTSSSNIFFGPIN